MVPLRGLIPIFLKSFSSFRLVTLEPCYSEFVTSKHLFLILKFSILFRCSSVSGLEDFVLWARSATREWRVPGIESVAQHLGSTECHG